MADWTELEPAASPVMTDRLQQLLINPSLCLLISKGRGFGHQLGGLSHIDINALTGFVESR